MIIKIHTVVTTYVQQKQTDDIIRFMVDVNIYSSVSVLSVVNEMQIHDRRPNMKMQKSAITSESRGVFHAPPAADRISRRLIARQSILDTLKVLPNFGLSSQIPYPRMRLQAPKSCNIIWLDLLVDPSRQNLVKV